MAETGAAVKVGAANWMLADEQDSLSKLSLLSHILEVRAGGYRKHKACQMPLRRNGNRLKSRTPLLVWHFYKFLGAENG